MADDFDDVVNNVKRSSTWMRIVYMIGFCIVLYVVSVVIWFLTGAQALFSIFTGSDNRNLRLLGASLAEYVNQILKFITYNSQDRPFPFRPFPQTEETGFAGDDGSPFGDSDFAQPDEDFRQSEGPGGEADGGSGGQFDDLAFLSRQEVETEEDFPEEPNEAGGDFQEEKAGSAKQDQLQNALEPENGGDSVELPEADPGKSQAAFDGDKDQIKEPSSDKDSKKKSSTLNTEEQKSTGHESGPGNEDESAVGRSDQ